MAWDDSKQNDANDSTGELPAEEWNAHVDDQKAHSTRHESGGADEISVAGLAGQLADPQPPLQEDVEDYVAALVTGGTDISTTYDDSNGVLTIDYSGSSGGSGSSWSQTTVTADHTASDDESIWVDASGGAVTVTLPTPTQGVHVRVLAIDATNTVTVSRNGSEDINGQASDLTLVEGESSTLESDGTNWWEV